MRWLCFILVSALLFLFPNPSLAKIYSWKDANGIKNYSSEPPPKGITATDSWQEIDSVPLAVEDVIGPDGVGNQRETPVTLMGDNVIVPVTFGYDGIRKYMTLLLDTGATHTAVFETAAIRNDIDDFVPLEAHVAGGGVIDAKGVKVDYLKVGPKIQQDAKVVVIKHAGAPTEYDGLLGMSFLRDHRYYIDFERKVIVWLD